MRAQGRASQRKGLVAAGVGVAVVLAVACGAVFLVWAVLKVINLWFPIF